MKIALALGSGAARGCAHIGVINALARLGLVPDVICGCSMGALVGAAHASGNLEKLEAWMRALTRRQMLRYFELSLSGRGLVDARTFNRFLAAEVCEASRTIETLPLAFATVATEIRSGREIWLTEGNVLDAVRASIALPGLFRPAPYDGGWLVDGGLVNPVPVSVCRALGADAVIAVNLNTDIVGKHFNARAEEPEGDALSQLWRRLGSYSSELLGSRPEHEDLPGLFDVLSSSFHIMQDRITRSRLAGDPPDLTISPRLSRIGLLEFYRATEAIAEGDAAVVRADRELEYLLERRAAGER